MKERIIITGHNIQITRETIPDPQPPASPLLLGLHDHAGGQWMRQQDLTGLCVVHRQIQRDPVRLNYTHLQTAGITVICRLNYGYADGTGTLPPPGKIGHFIHAATETMIHSTGVDYWHVGNEVNNKGEWPNDFQLTPDYVTDLYNILRSRTPDQVKLGPPPIDPYFGPGSNCRDWFYYIWHNIDGADWIPLHAKTQTNNPSDVWSSEKFQDWPLQWQFLHLRTVETALEELPDRFNALPIFVTETNPQHVNWTEGEIGWQPHNAAWIHQAAAFYRQHPRITGAAFYRYDQAGDQAPFALENKPKILQMIKEEIRGTS